MASQNVIEDFTLLRKRAAAAVRSLSEIAATDGSTVTVQKRTVRRADLLQEMADKLEHNQFVLAVVGEFSRGKSSLINALLDQPALLPTAIEPTTAAVTILTYAPKRKISVTFEDGHVADDLSVEQLSHYVLGQDLDGRRLREELARRAREAEQTGNFNDQSFEELEQAVTGEDAHRRVRTVQVELPSKFLEDGLCLVDTPGIGSVNPEHGLATRRFIHRADAVIFLINTDPVIGQSEYNFLAFLKDYVNRFLFVVTKIDRFNAIEAEQSLNYTARVITEYAGLPNPPIYPVSARRAMEARREKNAAKYEASGFPEFLQGLHVFLVRARGQEFIRQNVKAAITHLQDLRNATLVELQGLETKIEDLPAKLDKAREALSSARDSRKAILNELARRVQHVENAMENFSPEAKVRIELLLHQGVDELLEGYDFEQFQHASETIPVFIRDRLYERLQEPFETVSRQVVDMREDILRASKEHLGEMERALSAEFEGLRLPEQIDVSLNFETDPFENRLKRIGTLTIGSSLALSGIGLLLVSTAGLAAPLLPGLGLAVMAGSKFFARQRLAAMRRRVKAAIDPVLNKLLGDLFQSVREEVLATVGQFQEEIQAFMHDSIANLEEALERLEKERPEPGLGGAERKMQLRTQQLMLEQIEGELSLIGGPGW